MKKNLGKEELVGKIEKELEKSLRGEDFYVFYNSNKGLRLYWRGSIKNGWWELVTENTINNDYKKVELLEGLKELKKYHCYGSGGGLVTDILFAFKEITEYVLALNSKYRNKEEINHRIWMIDTFVKPFKLRFDAKNNSFVKL